MFKISYWKMLHHILIKCESRCKFTPKGWQFRYHLPMKHVKPGHYRPTSIDFTLLEYCDVIYDSCTMYESEKLDKLQRKASLLCTGAFRITSNEKLLKELGWPKLTNRRTSHRLVLFYKILNDLTPQYLKQLCNLIPHNTYNYQLRRNNSFLVSLIHRESFSNLIFQRQFVIGIRYQTM